MTQLGGIIFNVTQNPFLSRPLGGHRIAHYLREQGWDIEVVDWANWWTLEKLQTFFKTRHTTGLKFVGFGHLFSMWTDNLERFVYWIKINYPEVKIISGSAVNPMFSSKVIDYYIQGFGEYAIVELLKYIVGNGKRPKFNLNVGNGQKIISAIHAYPAFPMKSLMVKYQERDYILPDEWLAIEFARGCKFACSFCNFPVLGVKGDYTRDSDDFIEQMKDTYDRFGVKNYIVSDETFNDRTQKIIKFADAVNALDFDPWFSGYIRADLLVSRKDDIEHLLRMNFLGHFYGIESFNEKSSRSIGKGMASEKLKDGLSSIRSYFENKGSKRFRAHIGVIAGLPYETEKTLLDTFDWLKNNWQGHAFSIHPLLIPSNNKINQESKISSNLAKYNYVEMTEEEQKEMSSRFPLEVKTNFGNIVNPAMRKVVTEEIIWKNENMNFFDAVRIAETITKEKQNYDFRPGCHPIAYKLNSSLTVNERLNLTYDQLDNLLSFNLDSYIDKKLGKL